MLIKYMDTSKAYTTQYIFRISEAINDCYLFEPNGYLAIRGESYEWIDDKLEGILSRLSLDTNIYEIEGGISDWIDYPLYIVKLDAENMGLLNNYFDENQEIYFHGWWVSYFKNGEILMDIGHAIHGGEEFLSLSHRLDKRKIEAFKKRHGLI